MTTPAADRLIFAGRELGKVWKDGYVFCVGEEVDRIGIGLDYQIRYSVSQLKAQPPNQTPKQHLAAIRADRRARARRQKPRLKNPAKFVSYN